MANDLINQVYVMKSPLKQQGSEHFQIAEHSEVSGGCGMPQVSMEPLGPFSFMLP